MALIQTQPRRRSSGPSFGLIIFATITLLLLAAFLYFGLRPVDVTATPQKQEFTYDAFKTQLGQ